MKKILIFIPVLALLLAGCGQSAQPKAESFSGSVADLLARNKSAKCDLVAQQGENIISGTTYVSGTKARSDYQMKGANNQNMNSHMINDGTWMYTWSDDASGQAMKIKLDTLNSDQFNSSGAQNQAQDSGLEEYQSDMNYQCYNWATDASLFVPPADLNFIDFSQIMEDAFRSLPATPTGQNSGLPDNLCSQCDALPNAQAKSSCQQSLGCQ